MRHYKQNIFNALDVMIIVVLVASAGLRALLVDDEIARDSFLKCATATRTCFLAACPASLAMCPLLAHT